MLIYLLRGHTYIMACLWRLEGSLRELVLPFHLAYSQIEFGDQVLQRTPCC